MGISGILRLVCLFAVKVCCQAQFSFSPGRPEFPAHRTDDLKILCVGDSTTQGVGASTCSGSCAYKSYPWQLADLLAGLAAPGLAIPDKPDSRWSLGAGWDFLGGVGFGQWGDWYAAGPAEALVFRPGGGIPFDRYDVYYATFARGGGTITATATGGIPVNIDTNRSGKVGVDHFTVAGGVSSVDSSVSISVRDGNVHILGVEAWSAAVRRIRIANAGAGRMGRPADRHLPPTGRT